MGGYLYSKESLEEVEKNNQSGSREEIAMSHILWYVTWFINKFNMYYVYAQHAAFEHDLHFKVNSKLLLQTT